MNIKPINVQLQILNIKAKWLNRISQLVNSEVEFDSYYDEFRYSDRLEKIKWLFAEMEKELKNYRQKAKKELEERNKNETK